MLAGRMVFGAAQARRSVTKLSKRVCTFNQFAGHSVSCALAYVDYAEENPYIIPSSSHCFDFAQLHQRMSDLAKSGRAGDALKVLNSMTFSNWRPSVRDYNRLLCCYAKSGNMVLDELVSVYASLRQSGVLPNATTYNVLFNALVFLGSLHDALLVVVEMHRNGFLPSFQCLSKLLKKLLSSDNMKDIVYVVDFMLLLGYSPTEPDLNLLMKKLVCLDMLNEAYRVLNMMVCKGKFCSPNPILWALCKHEDSVVALSFLCCMKKRGFVQNICSYTALVYGFSKHGLSDEVDKVLREMDSFGFKPNIKTYTIMVKRLCESGKIEEAFDILDKMEKDGCQPDMIIYNVILHSLSYSNRLERIEEMCPLLGRKGLSPDPYTYTAIAGGLLKTGKVDRADKILDDVISRNKMDVDVGVYNLYLHTLCLTDRLSQALSVVQKMREEGLRPNTISYNIVLKGLCLQGNLEKALQFLDKFEPDGVSFNTILSAACRLRDSSIIVRVLRKMQCQGIKLSVVSFTCLIKYYCSVGQIAEGYKWLEYMLRDGIRPSTTTLNVLIHGVCRWQLLSVAEAEKIFTRFRNMGVLPDSTTFNILLYAALRARADVLAHEFLREMYRQGVELDMVTHGTINNALCKMGKISDAFERLNLMLENGVSPDVVIYNNFLSAMLRRRKLCDVFSLLKHMAKNKREPDIRSAEIMLRAMLKVRMKGIPQGEKLLEFVSFGEGSDALSLLKQMAMDRSEPNIIASAEIVLQAMVKGRKKSIPRPKKLLKLASCGNSEN